MSKVIIVLGPTAVGKTQVSIRLAQEMNGEIVSADSMQVYKYMDIGTAKPSNEEMCGIKHYLIDEINPDEEFSVARFQRLANEYIDTIENQRKIPIIAGGTGLYINSLLYNINFSETISDWSLREELKKEAEEKGNQYLHDKLKEIDPEAAEKLHVNDVKRVIRAIEVYNYTKTPISTHQELSRLVPSKHEFIVIGLNMDRQKLYERINLRVDKMFENGLVDEVKGLIELGYHKNSVAMQGIGYKEVLAFLAGEYSLNEAIELIKQGSRRYAKRQITWFKRIDGVFWFDALQYENVEALSADIKTKII